MSDSERAERTVGTGCETAADVGLRVVLNGASIQLPGCETLAALLVARGYGDVRVATAVNGEFVAATQRKEYRLADGDHVEIVSPRQGG